MTRREAIVSVATLAASAACGVKAEGPPPIEIDRTPCAHCGMLISEPRYAAAYKSPRREAQVFDDIGCLLASATREAGRGELRFWFHDARTAHWIAGSEATFVKSARFRTPMSGGLVAYRDAVAAKLTAAQHDGQVIGDLNDLFRAERLRPERGDGVNRAEGAAPSEKRAGVGPRERQEKRTP